MPETMKIFGSTKKIINKTKNGENVPSLEVVEVVLVQRNLVDNKSDISYTFTPNKSYAYLLNVEPSNLVFPKTYNAEFNETILTFMDPHGRLLEIEDKVNSTLFTKK